ncbi:hypothetical protein BV22DRAFT_1004924 [Leucogyrophana mollusca]|uniref:Uncharacterized protein n=1 Tax=Leucogyrophana mollusca TaxID=85980 RepID=A0ACB8BUA1_9AGAM|nr:hypothetical protein BV22DRAFT_1004924 [Leucogyrophana mollusca]
MHAERFVNLAPLSLLANTLGLWFKDVRTHPPIVFKFPPPEAEADVEQTVVTLSGLLQGVTPYAMLDDTHLAGFSPPRKASFVPPATSPAGAPAPEARFLNTTLDVDLRSLNLHLMLKVKEIAGCSEAMWEWVCQHKGTVGELTRAEFDGLLIRFEL